MDNGKLLAEETARKPGLAPIPARVVNGAHARNVPGRNKSDVSDCQWLQQLHSCGLLSKSFVLAEEIGVLRSYRRLREDYIERAADSVRHMQKACDLMNVKFHTVVSQLHGASGLRIVDAILAGERTRAEAFFSRGSQLQEGLVPFPGDDQSIR